jgi:uncharacterized protein YicC (UPF0701 family)
VEQSLSQIYSLLQEKGRGLNTDIQDRLQNIAADLDELDETIQVILQQRFYSRLSSRTLLNFKLTSEKSMGENYL